MVKVNPKSLENLKPFVKGQSGNPYGRKKGVATLTTQLKLLLEQDIQFTIKGSQITKSGVQWVLDSLIKKAAKGDISAIKEVFDRVEGKAKQSIDLGNKEGETFEHNFNFHQLTKEQKDEIVKIRHEQ